VALESVRAREELEHARLEVLDRLALAAEYRDQGTHAHTARVARTALNLARALGLPATEASLIGQAAPLHDVGKLAVPEALLLKPGRLTPAEFRQIEQHTTAGAAILAGSASDVLRRAEEIALTHHEHWDGTGYPSGLRGSAIPISGRIVALADVFDALTHARPYKSAWPLGAATAEIRRLRDRQFDPEVVDAFLSLRAELLLEPVDLRLAS
jgi:putative two-component system response regulator